MANLRNKHPAFIKIQLESRETFLAATRIDEKGEKKAAQRNVKFFGVHFRLP